MTFPIYLCSEVVRALGFREQCSFARSAGYNGLEVAPFTLGAEPHRLPDREIRELRSIAEGEGTKIAGLHWLLAAPEGLSITSNDDAVFERTVEVGRGLVALCRDLGGSYLVHGSPLQRKLEPGQEEEGRRRGIAYFAAMAEAAEKAGVVYYLEPLSREDTGFVNTLDDALAVIAEIGSAALGTMLDCYAASRNGEDIVDLLRRWIPEGAIRHVHFNDPNRRGPGEGSLGFGPILDVLCELGYEGSAAVEPFVYEPDGPACAARAIGYLRGLMEARQTRNGNVSDS